MCLLVLFEACRAHHITTTRRPFPSFIKYASIFIYLNRSSLLRFSLRLTRLGVVSFVTVAVIPISGFKVPVSSSYIETKIYSVCYRYFMVLDFCVLLISIRLCNNKVLSYTWSPSSTFGKQLQLN